MQGVLLRGGIPTVFLAVLKVYSLSDNQSMEKAESVALRLQRLSMVIPDRDEEGCIAATVQHFHLELALKNVSHEIVVVDDGSSDRTLSILEELKDKIRAGCSDDIRCLRFRPCNSSRVLLYTGGCRGGHDGGSVGRFT